MTTRRDAVTAEIFMPPYNQIIIKIVGKSEEEIKFEV